MGIYSTFANHGTVDHENFQYYSGDHQGAAERVVEAAIRRAGHVPGSQAVINAFANSDAGDMTSGIQYNGPADAEYVGRREAAAMLAAWRQAGHAMTRHPAFALRFTRVCFCGQQTSAGAIDSVPWIGKAAGAGSEEGRTIFYDDGIAHEGDRLPIDIGPQGDKIPVLDESGNVPQAVPFTVLRLGDRLITTVPGEPTVGTGEAIRRAVAAAVAGSGITQIVVVGYAGDYLSYFTTPAEYEQQAYEGGFTLYGHYSSLVLQETLAELAKRLVAGQPAPAPYPYDPSGGVHLSTAAYGNGATSATAISQPTPAVHLGHTGFGWDGGANGIDRPGGPGVRHHPAPRAPPLGMGRGRPRHADPVVIGRQRALPRPLGGPAHRHPRLVPVPGHRQGLQAGLAPLPSGARRDPHPQVSGDTVRLGYPQPFLLNDWTYRPARASGGQITFIVRGKRRRVRERTASAFPIPAGAGVSIPRMARATATGTPIPRRSNCPEWSSRVHLARGRSMSTPVKLKVRGVCRIARRTRSVRWCPAACGSARRQPARAGDGRSRVAGDRAYDRVS